MKSRFTVLGSGSTGNASLLETPAGAVLLDCGLPPRDLSARLAMVGSSWESISAVVITHTHTDHWNRHTLEHLRRLNIRFFAHSQHHVALASVTAYQPLRRAGLTEEYTAEGRFEPVPGLSCQAVAVQHDSDPTFALRCDLLGASEDKTWSIGLASDLGVVTDSLLAAFAGIDLLAIEFNHDLKLERTSRRPRFLIERVLGDFGHLSNCQAGEAVQALAMASEPGQLCAVVQLHLSRDCNSPMLAHEAGRAALACSSPGTRLITATHDRPAEPVELQARPARSARIPRLPARPRPAVQLRLPGFE